LGLDETSDLARIARAAASGAHRPAIVAITADATPSQMRAIVAALDPDVVQLAGTETVAKARAVGRRTWKVLQVPPADPDDVARAASDLVTRGRKYLAAGVERIMLDAAGGPHPGGTGTRASERLAAAVARDLPVMLAGGLSATNVGAALRAVPAVAVDVATGVERPRQPGQRPTKDPFRVALFAKRARAARDDRPNIAFGPTPVHAGLLAADGAGRWGLEGDFGGRYVPETLMAALEQLEAAYDALRQDPVFWAELRELLGTFAGRPTALYRADRLAVAVRTEAARLAGSGRRAPGIPALRLYLKREDLAHTGAHKINNALGQALLTRRLGKTRVIAETGAGQHGVATATACALLDLPCVVYMGAEDIERQGPNVLRMRALGAEVRSVTSGTATLKDAVNEAMRDWVTNVETTHYVLGSAMGPHPYPTIVRDLQRRIGDEAAAQITAVEGRLPDLAVACVGGGSNAIGLLARFIGEPSVRLAVVEAAGDGIETGRHAAAILGGTPGILHGSRSLMLQDADGQVIEAHSASAGLDYPGIGPQLAALAEAGRIEVAAATDREAVAAMKSTTRTEGILPALETAHAVAALPKLLSGGSWPDEILVLLGFSGRGDKDLAALERFADVQPWDGAT
ncbi:MAG: tryptophan synthase subunit beta, partial [Chloroflexota bacterium]